MAIQVVHLPNPAAGAEWAYTIPGQYLVTLIGVQATLTTTANPTTSPDQSGNGRPLTYTSNPFLTFGATGPFAGSPNRAVAEANGARGTGTNIGTRAASTDWNVANITVGAWVNLSQNQSTIIWAADSVPGVQHQGWVFGTDTATPPHIYMQYLNGVTKTSTGTVTANAWHFVAATYDGANFRFYIDGAAAGVVAAVATVAAISEPMMVGNDPSHLTSQELMGSIAGVFVNAAAISGARIATYYTDATTVSAAQYRTDVLADSPLALWLLDDTQTTSPRTVSFAVQNGAATVATFPTDVPIAQPGTFVYSWQVLGPGAAQSTDGTTITVPIPALTLPPGYRIGSNTPDIASTDRWSNVTVWFDDGTGTPNPAGQGPPYLDALLVPTGWQGG